MSISWRHRNSSSIANLVLETRPFMFRVATLIVTISPGEAIFCLFFVWDVPCSVTFAYGRPFSVALSSHFLFLL